ncbi:MAG: hypothetical protein EVJ48_03020 [Candidatus Acidulodesulfobacterium acidiphilum]|uniref:Uncharacterized protein n=1 Tax=Candidatus Acidulodesulfobacterium acidiphilum TaxID=2597224 RepID=A0A520XFE2_9DELT|nr:MAG: hypothetical protein EVJ48_03020 [Candidatus Acidulodesulfobacterium acidiphilum]
MKISRNAMNYAVLVAVSVILTFLINLVLTKYIYNVKTQSRIYVLNLKSIVDLKRKEMNEEALKHPLKNTPAVTQKEITIFIGDINADAKKYENGVIIAKQVVIGGGGYKDITNSLKKELEKQGVL